MKANKWNRCLLTQIRRTFSNYANYRTHSQCLKAPSRIHENMLNQGLLKIPRLIDIEKTILTLKRKKALSSETLLLSPKTWQPAK